MRSIRNGVSELVGAGVGGAAQEPTGRPRQPPFGPTAIFPPNSTASRPTALAVFRRWLAPDMVRCSGSNPSRNKHCVKDLSLRGAGEIVGNGTLVPGSISGSRCWLSWIKEYRREQIRGSRVNSVPGFGLELPRVGSSMPLLTRTSYKVVFAVCSGAQGTKEAVQ